MERLHQTINEAVSEGIQLQVAFGLERAETHFRDLLREINLAEIATRNERGLVYRMQNNYTKAEIDFLRAFDLSRQIGDFDGELTALGGLIDLARKGNFDPTYKKGKNLPVALRWQNEAKLVLTEMPEDPPRISRVAIWTQFGLLEHELLQDSQALESYNLAKEECRNLILKFPDNPNIKNHLIGDVRGIGNATVSLAELAEMTNNPTEAISWYQQARMITEKLEDGVIKTIDKDINNIAIEALKKFGLK